MSRHSRAGLLSLSCAASWLAAGLAGAAQIKGSVEPPPVTTVARILGYTKTRVGAPARSAAAARADVVVFLKVKESLPIPPSTEPYRVSVSGLRLNPAVAGCVVDGKVRFTNEERTPVTLLIDQKPFAELKPGESKIYDCASAGRDLRSVRVKEWPHIRGAVFVGDVGVVAQPSANGGAFSMQAPQGKYELHIIGVDGPFPEIAQNVEVAKTDVDLGHIFVAGSGGAAAPSPADAPKGPAKGATKPGAPKKHGDQPVDNVDQPGSER